MHLTTKIIKSLSDIPQDRWERLEGKRDFYLSYPWLASIEATSPPHLYILVYNEAKCLVGALPFYQCEEESGSAYEPGSLFLEQLGIPTPENGAVLVGTRCGYSNRLLLDTQLSNEQRLAVAQHLLSVASELAEQQKRIAVMLYLTDDAIADLLHMPVSPMILLDAQAVIDITTHNEREHLLTFSSKRRQSILRESRAFAQAGYTVTSAKLSDCVMDIAPLLSNLETKYGHSFPLERALRAFRAKIPYLDNISTILLCLQGNDVVGFSHLIEWGNILYVRACGFNYERIQKSGEYGTLVYYEPLKYAMQHNLQQLRFGVGSLEAKVLRGCRIEPLWACVIGETWQKIDGNTTKKVNTSMQAKISSQLGRVSSHQRLASLFSRVASPQVL